MDPYLRNSLRFYSDRLDNPSASYFFRDEAYGM
jgi:hypothetical protein